MKTRRISTGISVFIFGLCFWLMPVVSRGSDRLNPNIQAALFYKIFNFNKTLTELSIPEIKIIVLKGDNQKEIFTAFKTMFKDKKLGEKSIVILKENSLDKLADDCQVVYVTEGNESKIDSIIEFCNKHKILGISNNRYYVKRGLAVAVIMAEGKARIFVSRDGIKRCGSKFSAMLMKLAKII